jgi:replication-associated recombination protein RarA
MPNCAVDEILASLRNAQDGIVGCQSIFKEHGGLWFEPVAQGDLYQVYLWGMLGSGPTAVIAIADWMMKAQRHY